jgi:hypothetical protein
MAESGFNIPTLLASMRVKMMGMERILRNANAAGVAFENRRRSSRIFGKPNDTGRTVTEVQDALCYHTLIPTGGRRP